MSYGGPDREKAWRKNLRQLALDVDEEARNALSVDDGPLLADRLRVD